MLRCQDIIYIVIYKVLKPRDAQILAVTCLTGIVIYKVLKLDRNTGKGMIRLTDIVIYKVLKLLVIIVLPN